jgi:hypothetical protein
MNSFSLLSIEVSPEHVTKVLQSKVADGAAIFEFYDSPRGESYILCSLCRLKSLKLKLSIILLIFQYLF